MESELEPLLYAKLLVENDSRVWLNTRAVMYKQLEPSSAAGDY